MCPPSPRFSIRYVHQVCQAAGAIPHKPSAAPAWLPCPYKAQRMGLNPFWFRFLTLIYILTSLLLSLWHGRSRNQAGDPGTRPCKGHSWMQRVQLKWMSTVGRLEGMGSGPQPRQIVVRPGQVPVEGWLGQRVLQLWNSGKGLGSPRNT